MGKDYFKGLKDGLSSDPSRIVAEESYEVGEPTIDSHVVRLRYAFRPAGRGRRMKHCDADGHVGDRCLGKPGSGLLASNDASAFSGAVGNDAGLDISIGPSAPVTDQ